MHVFGNNAGRQWEIFEILCPPGLYLRTAFYVKRSNIPQIFWVYVLRRMEYGKYRI
jgi:hypothetical protein